MPFTWIDGALCKEEEIKGNVVFRVAVVFQVMSIAYDTAIH